MSEKDKTSDSGIDLKKSDSGSGSFAGVDKSSWKDFDDSGQGSSRRGTYDDDDDDDYYDDEPQKVDLDAFISDGTPAGDDVGDEEEGEGEDEEEEEGSEEVYDVGIVDEEDEGEYETEEEEDESNVQLASDEILTNIETSSAQRLLEQRESLKRSAKEKKKDLLNEYMRDVKRFNRLRKKNFLLGMKIETHIDQKKTIIEKYLQNERDEQERIKEAERLKRQQAQEACEKEQRKLKREKQKKEKPLKDKKKKKSKTARFSLANHFDNEPESFPNLSLLNPEIQFLLRKKFDFTNVDVPNVSLKKLKEEGWVYDTRLIRDKGIKILFSHKSKKCQRPRFLKKPLRKFSFMRTRFYEDVKKPLTKHQTKNLMNLNIDKLRSKSSKMLTNKGSPATGVNTSQVSIPAAAPSSTQVQPPSQHGSGSQINKSRSRVFPVPTFAGGRRRQFALTQEALGLARSKSRMALDHRKQEQKIRLSTDPTDQKNLHHFKFEFADPRLTAKQASVKLRDELIRMLHRRHVPTEQLRWPLEVKGVEFDGKNPYGRVSLNYTRLSHHEKELPHTAYRILLTNMAFLRTKEQRLHSIHRKNMVELEEERDLLESGLREIFNEIVEGLRIWASLCGISEVEKREARNGTESFITELQRFFDEFLTEMLIKLYKSIHSSEFVLRRLWISEGKGEGAELHEFKDIMRGREKLKAEHRSIVQSISRYQRHSNRVLTVVKNSGKKLREAQECVGTMNSELDHLKQAVSTMVEGMYFCQETVRKQHLIEKELKMQAGILSSPALSDDYFKLLKKIEDTKSKRLDLQFQYNGKIREMEKIMPTRYNRYKMRS